MYKRKWTVKLQCLFVYEKYFTTKKHCRAARKFWGKIVSIVFTSDENLFIILPIGVTSKTESGKCITCFKIFSCMCLAAYMDPKANVRDWINAKIATR